MTSHFMPLSPIDLVFLGRSGYSVEFLFVFDYPLDLARLRKSAEAVSRKFWPMRSRLCEDSTFGMAFEGSNSIDLAVIPDRAELDLNAPRELAAFHRPVFSVPGEPLSRLTYGRVGHSSALAINISHCVVDGYSFFMFAGALAAHYRSGGWNVSKWVERLKLYGFRPDLDRRKLQPKTAEDDSKILSDIDAEQVYQRTGISWAGPRTMPGIESAKWKFIVFSESKLKDMLAEAAKTTEARVSRHDVIAAALWQETARDWGVGSGDLTCTSAFDYRRVNKDLSPLYFGNAVRCAAVRLNGQQVIEMPTGKLAAMIRSATSAIDDQAARDSLLCVTQIRRAKGMGALQEMHVSNPQSGLLVTNLSRFPLDRFDFGGGAARGLVPLTSAPRAAVLLAHPDGIVARVQGP